MLVCEGSDSPLGNAGSILKPISRMELSKVQKGPD